MGTSFCDVSSSICPPSPSAQCSHIESRSRGSFSCVGKLDAGSALNSGHALSQQSGPCTAGSPHVGKGCSHLHPIRTFCRCAASMNSHHGVPMWQHFIFLSLRNSCLQLPCTWDCGHALELPRNISTRLCWNCCIPLGPVQVQTPEEPEPDLNLGSLLLRFRFAKFHEPDLKSGFRFCPQTESNWTVATLVLKPTYSLQ